MKNLKISSSILILTIFLSSGCATSSFRVQNQKNDLVEIAVSPDRILLECESITDYSGDLIQPYGFMMHILDEVNTVITVNQGSVLEKDICFDRLRSIEKILKNGKEIYIGGMGDITKPRKQNLPRYEYVHLGKFPANGRYLQFLAVWNDRGQCYDAYRGEEKPCPRDEFPLSGP